MQNRLSVFIVRVFSLFLLSVSVFAATYKVANVASWDTLNVRSGPGTQNGVLFKLPHNAEDVRMLDAQQQVGQTLWVKVDWRGQQGWVSKHYLAQQTAPQNTVQVNRPASAAEPTTLPLPQSIDTTDIIKKKQSGMWVLECGSASPYWRVEVLPKWLRGTLGEHKTGMPITHKRQERGEYHNVALETELRGANRWNRLQLTLNYTKSCYSSLTKRREAFRVKGMFNNDSISGCCRAFQVK